MTPSKQAYIDNILNGNVLNQSKKIYNAILRGDDNIGVLCSKLKIARSTITARLDKLQENGLIKKLGIKNLQRKQVFKIH